MRMSFNCVFESYALALPFGFLRVRMLVSESYFLLIFFPGNWDRIDVFGVLSVKEF